MDRRRVPGSLRSEMDVCSDLLHSSSEGPGLFMCPDEALQDVSEGLFSSCPQWRGNPGPGSAEEDNEASQCRPQLTSVSDS